MFHEVFVRLSNCCWGRWGFALPVWGILSSVRLQAFPDVSSFSAAVACVFAFGWSTDGRHLVLRVAHDKGPTEKSLRGTETETVSFLLHRDCYLATGGHCDPLWGCNPVFCCLRLFSWGCIPWSSGWPVQGKLFALLTSWWLFTPDLRFLCWQISPSVSQNLLLFKVKGRVTP